MRDARSVLPAQLPGVGPVAANVTLRKQEEPKYQTIAPTAIPLDFDLPEMESAPSIPAPSASTPSAPAPAQGNYSLKNFLTFSSSSLRWSSSTSWPTTAPRSPCGLRRTTSSTWTPSTSWSPCGLWRTTTSSWTSATRWGT